MEDHLIACRKKDHIRICLKNRVCEGPCSLDRFYLPYRTLPDVNLEEISLQCKLLPQWNTLRAPFMIASMTGGEHYGRIINENIAKACEAEGIAFGLGSMRIIDRLPSAFHTFDVRAFCPSVPMFANVGIVQLNYGFTIEKIASLASKLQADGLCVHVNALQEAVQLEGETNFSGLIPKLRDLVDHLNIPVMVKEVGHGFDGQSAMQVRNCGVKMLDVSGLGGTSWAWVEGQRSTSASRLGYLMRDRGLSLVNSLTQCKEIEDLTLIASGGIRNGLHVAKSLALGAHHCAAALPFLQPATHSSAAVQKEIASWKKELRVMMMTCGASTIDDLRKIKPLEM